MSLKQRIIMHEGYRSTPYLCPNGKITIGYGFNLSDGINEDLAGVILDYQIARARRELMSVFTTVDIQAMGPIRVEAMVEMIFNLGLPGFRSFKKMIHRIKNRQWHRAAAEAINSRWAMQVGDRATQIAHQIETGELL